MKITGFGISLALAASLALLSPSTAAPFPDLSQRGVDANLVIEVGGCHSGTRRHYVPEFGRSTSHFHRRNCRPVRAAASGRDCHREARRHFLPQYRGSVVHRHVGSNCRIRVLRRYYSGRRPDFCVQFGAVRYCEY
jgi:hypothetical protein